MFRLREKERKNKPRGVREQMAHWPRVRLTALLAAEAISSRLESTRTLERAKSGELLAGNHYRVGRKAGTKWEKCFGKKETTTKRRKKRKKKKQQDERGMKCLRRPLVAVPRPQEIE